MRQPKAKIKFSPSMMAPPVDTSDRLAKISLYYHREAERCLDNRAYLAACVFVAASLEALLLSFCYVYDRTVRRTSVYKKKNFEAKRNRFYEFNLYQLIEIAAELKWIPAKEITLSRRKTTLQKLLHTARKTRNTIHPAVWAKDGGPTRMRKADASSIFETFDVTREWLLYRVHAALRRRMVKEGILPTN